jgi:hypothetical protein
MRNPVSVCVCYYFELFESTTVVLVVLVLVATTALEDSTVAVIGSIIVVVAINHCKGHAVEDVVL